MHIVRRGDVQNRIYGAIRFQKVVVKHRIRYSICLTRLEKFWMHQDVLYDYTADLIGIGDRSVHVTKDV